MFWRCKKTSCKSLNGSICQIITFKRWLLLEYDCCRCTTNLSNETCGVFFFLNEIYCSFFFFSFAPFVFCEAVLTDWAFCSGNSTCEADANVHFFFFFASSACVALKRMRWECLLNSAGLYFLTFHRVVGTSYCVLSLVQYLGFCMLRTLHGCSQGLLFRYGCRASSDGPASSIVCSQCSPVLPVMMSRLSYLKP